jgi:hypothetical protein
MSRFACNIINTDKNVMLTISLFMFQVSSFAKLFNNVDVGG